MRSYFITILLLLPIGLRAQPSAVVKQGKWVSTELNSLIFRNDYVLDAVFGGTPEHSNYVFKRDTLVLVKNYYSSADEFAFERSDSAKFFIKTATARQLVLVPANTNARNMVRKPEYRFENLLNMAAEKINFQWLKMSYTKSDQTDRQVNIDRHGNVIYSAARTAQTPAGKYTAQLSHAQFNTLQQLLQRSLLSRLNTWRQNVALTDVPELRLEVTTTDGHMYRLQSQLIPVSIEALVMFVWSLPEKLTLTLAL